MRKVVALMAMVTLLFSMTVVAQQSKPKEKAKRECPMNKKCTPAEMKACKKDKKMCSAAEMKSCPKDKKAGCCFSKTKS